MMGKTRRVAILGSSGSIGTQTLDVIDRLIAAGRTFDVVALATGSSIDVLADQTTRYRPRVISVADEANANALRSRVADKTEVLHGADALVAIAEREDVDILVNALYGSAGLPPTLAALALGKTVALANKESIVIAGATIHRLLREHGGTLLSIDSEHHALHQCLHGHRVEDVERLILTASGGPFLHRNPETLSQVTPEDALAHPSWSMGRKITVDSATMVNKAFEVIVAHHLYGVPYERIDVVIQPGSYVHSMVEFREGSIKAELGPRDMRIPIQNLLIDPERVDTGFPRLRFESPLTLEFLPFEESRFPAFTTVIEAAQDGGSALAAMNGADEALIARFLDREIPFPAIADGLAAVLNHWRSERKDDAGEDTLTLPELLAVDAWARDLSQHLSFERPV